jgi:hypothetical protein
MGPHGLLAGIALPLLYIISGCNGGYESDNDVNTKLNNLEYFCGNTRGKLLE